MTVIDLGERYGELPTDPEPRRSRWLTARWPRIGAVLIALLATTAASAPMPSVVQTELVVPARLGSHLWVDREQFYIVEEDEGTGRITARRVGDGAVLWRVSAPVPGRLLVADRVGGTLIVSGHYERPGGQDPDVVGGQDPDVVGDIAGLDRASGSRAWRHSADLQGVGTGGEVLLRSRSSGRSAPRTLFAVDPVTGTMLWSHPVPADAQLAYDYQGARLSLIALGLPTGRVELRDVASGGLLGAVALPAAPPPPRRPGSPDWSLSIDGDLLFVSDGRGGTVAYGLDRLDLRWSIPEQSAAGMSSCGRWLCATSLRSGIQVYDRSTGQLRWADRRWSMVWAAGDQLVTVETAARNPASLVVLDTATGSMRGDLGYWEALTLTDGGSAALAVRVVPDGRAWVARLDLATRTVRILMVLRDVSGDCTVYPKEGLVTCRRKDGALALWRLPG